MNIFVTDTSPAESAKNLDSKRVNKMLLESCQMLSTAVNEHGGNAPYKSTHRNHPSNIWCRSSVKNWLWLFDHAAALSTIYSLETGKIHKCHIILNEISTQGLIHFIPKGELTPFVNCAAHSGKGISFKHLTDTPEAYRKYLIARWNTDTRKPTWTNRNMPNWVKLDNSGVFVYSS